MLSKRIFQKSSRLPLVLVVLDGWGVGEKNRGNAIILAQTPTMDMLNKKYSHTLLSASGLDVGLPTGQAGNSEAGHMNIGAGRVVDQDSVVISKSISDGTFFKNSAFANAIHHAKKYKSQVHLMGLLTDQQSAHADPDHLTALLVLLKQEGVKNVFLHLFTDGRDSPPFVAIKLLRQLKKEFQNGEKIATIMGRFYSMDRRKNWRHTQMAYDAMVLGRGEHFDNSEEAIMHAYNQGVTDEFIKPSVIGWRDKPITTIKDNDSVIFFNLRSDRARQLSKAFVQDKFVGFKRRTYPKNLLFVAMTDFGPDLDSIITAYPSRDIRDTLPMVLKDYRQLYIAESEKYAHVTYFFNGGYADPVNGEVRVVIPSIEAENYAKFPQMRVKEITDYVIRELENKKFDFVTLNFANADMIAHTGDLKASIQAVAFVDQELGRLYELIVKKLNGTLVVVGDHGNADEVINIAKNEIDTQHSKAPVPFIVANDSLGKKYMKTKGGVLGSVAPTILDILKIKKPKEMTRESLFKK